MENGATTRRTPLRCRRAWKRAPWMAALAATVLGGAWLAYDGVREWRVRAWLRANGFNSSQWRRNPLSDPFEWVLDRWQARDASGRYRNIVEERFASHWQRLPFLQRAMYPDKTLTTVTEGTDRVFRLFETPPPGGAPYVGAIAVKIRT